MDDAVVAIRRHCSFPVCFELPNFDPSTDAMTLSEAIEKLDALSRGGPLSSIDKSRRERLQSLAGTQAPSMIVGFRKRTFRYVSPGAPVSEVFNRLVELDNTYVWRNAGTPEHPLVLIAPRVGTVLDWQVPSLCDDAADRSTGRVLRRGGPFDALLAVHGIARIELNSSNVVPDVPIDVCGAGMIALNVLNATSKAVGGAFAWTLSGTKALRFLTFQ